MKVKDRLEWRAAVDGSANQGGADESSNDTEKKPSQTGESVVKTLAKALLQIAHGVESRYMREPFGDAGSKDPKKEAKNKKKDKDDKGEHSDDTENDDDKTDVVVSSSSQKNKKGKSLFERWEESLTNCTSFPQIFLHLSSLEKSIIWSKSALHARCRICRRRGDGEHMLLCDGCDRGHHMYCLKPPVKTVPEGDWFCPNCRPKEVRPSPRKGRQTYIAESDDSESESEEEEEDEDEEEERSDEEEEEEESGEEGSWETTETEGSRRKDGRSDSHACVVCRRRGALVTCDKCPNVYHLSCANPPLKKVPKTKWLCRHCSGDKKSKKASSSNKSPGSSSQPGSRRESPVNARSRKRARSESDDDTPKRSRSSAKSKSVMDNEESDVKHYVSSYRGNNKVYQLKACEEIVNDLMKHEDSWPFLRPVSKKMVPDYYDIIKEPMDFSTIRNRIHKYQYTETTSLLRDVRLIFSNCKEYNKKSAPEYKAGLNLSQYFEKKAKEMQLEEETSSSSSPSSSGAIDSSGRSSKKKSRTH